MTATFDNPIKAKILFDKWTGMKDSLKLLAAKDSTVYVYDQSREDVWLCKNSKGLTFSCRKENLKVIG